MNRFHFLAVALAFACYGCSSSEVPLGIVDGKVTIDGKPLANSIVTFVPKQGGRASLGTTDADGNYQLIYSTRKGALVGTHDVTIQVNPEGVGASTESQEAPSIYDKQGAGGPGSSRRQSTLRQPQTAERSRKADPREIPQTGRVDCGSQNGKQ